MAAWIMAHDGAPHCPHVPNLYGTACELCGLSVERPRKGSPAERQDRDDFARELIAAYQDARARVEGQVSWLDA